MNKVPDELRLHISRLMPEGKWNIRDLLKIFSSELSAYERSASMATYKTQSYDRGYPTNEFSAVNLHVGGELNNTS